MGSVEQVEDLICITSPAEHSCITHIIIHYGYTRVNAQSYSDVEKSFWEDFGSWYLMPLTAE